jgi:hypothetical protein
VLADTEKGIEFPNTVARCTEADRKWKKWDFEVDKEYDVSDVIGACDAGIREAVWFEGGPIVPPDASRVRKDNQ